MERFLLQSETSKACKLCTFLFFIPVLTHSLEPSKISLELFCFIFMNLPTEVICSKRRCLIVDFDPTLVFFEQGFEGEWSFWANSRRDWWLFFVNKYVSLIELETVQYLRCKLTDGMLFVGIYLLMRFMEIYHFPFRSWSSWKCCKFKYICASSNTFVELVLD